MAYSRRSFIRSMLAVVLAESSRVGSGRTVNENISDGLALAMGKETGGQRASESELVKLEAPDIAEDGSIVPVSIESQLPNVETIWVFVVKNPNPLAARFDLDKELDPFVSLRVKMNESCDVVAMVKSGDGYFSTSKPVRVILGGCG